MISDSAILVVFIILTIGQIIALIYGKYQGIIYYFIVAPIGYFSLWQFGTWTLDRVCGLIIILYFSLSWKHLKRFKFFRSEFFLLFIYGILITIAFSTSWPTEYIKIPSPVYSTLRSIIQVINWAILFFTSWFIAKELAALNEIKKLKKFVILFGSIFCLYALYQVLAYELNLPLTGIRRPFEQTVYATYEEGYAAFKLGDFYIFRPGSIIGEPKGLGLLCVFILSVILSLKFEQKKISILFLLIVLLTLYFTASTSAWFGFLILVTLYIFLLPTKGVNLTGKLILFIILISVFSTLIYSFQSFAAIIEARTSERFLEGGFLADIAEAITIDIFLENPLYAISGVGLGGISFYIAEKVNGTFLIFSPNNGLLNIISNVGIVGLFIIIAISIKNMRLLFSKRLKVDGLTKSYSFIGIVGLFQCFIFSQSWLLIFSFSFLLASQIRYRRLKYEVPVLDKHSKSLPAKIL